MLDFLFPKVPQVTAEDVKKAMDNKERFILLDVRTPQEYGREKLKSSINIPLDSIQATIEKKLPNKSEKIFVYCLSGSRSVHAVAAMVKMGYTNVFDIKSGLLAWRVYNYPTV